MSNSSPGIRQPVLRSTKLRRPVGLITAALLLCWITSQSILAAAGDLDLTFGNGGKVTTDFGATLLSGAGIADIALQPDGKIVAVGIFRKSDFDRDLAVARYNKDGSLDPSFGTGGKVVTDLGLTLQSEFSLAVALHSDGKILVAVSGGVVFPIRLVRYNTDGSPDPAFGSGGILPTDIRGAIPQRLAIQPDGKIVLPGSSVDNLFPDFLVARYNFDGSTDLTFGTAGKAVTDFNNFTDFPSAIFLQPDGKILVGGRGGNLNVGSDFVIARYQSNGTPDLTFGTAGKLSTDFFGGDDEVISLNVTSGGNIIAAGIASRPGEFGPLGIARYNADGSLDPTFGAGGKASGPMIAGLTPPRAIAFQPDGKIIAGAISFTNSQDFSATRYNADGTVDPSFGSGGTAITDFEGKTETTSAVAIQPDGKIVIAGIAGVGLNSHFGLVRYQARLPRIVSASVSGKRLIVIGENFDSGAVILLNGKKQKTANDEQNPDTTLIGKKAGKKIARGEAVTLQIRNSDGALSQEFRFTRPNG